MKVLLDGHMIGKREGGNERYIHNLYEALHKIYGDTIYLYKGNKHESDIYRLLIGIPKKARHIKADIIHSTYIVPYVQKIKIVNMIHDLSFIKLGDQFSLKERFGFQYLLPKSIRRSDAILVPSKFTKNEFRKYYSQYGKSIHVTYESSDKIFRPIHKAKAREKIVKKFGITKPFCIALNSKYKRKNINIICESFLSVQKKHPDLQLVIVGGTKNISNTYLEKPDITVLEYVSDNELKYLYNASKLFIYFSTYEGFGLPILEALSCNVPVILSDTKLHREITHGKMLYVNAASSYDLANAIHALLTDNAKRKQLVRKGNSIKNKYSWERCARETMEVYQKLV